MHFGEGPEGVIWDKSWNSNMKVRWCDVGNAVSENYKRRQETKLLLWEMRDDKSKVKNVPHRGGGCSVLPHPTPHHPG